MAGNLVQGAVFTVMVVRAGMLRDPSFEFELAQQVQRSPRFFLNAPVVLDLREVAEFTGREEFAEAREILRRHTLTLIGVQTRSRRNLTLPLLPVLPASPRTRRNSAGRARSTLVPPQRPPRRPPPPAPRNHGW